VSKLKSILKNPFLIGAQGFAVGALLLWSADAPLQAPAAEQAPGVSLVDQARAAS
jgi:hypothetical protein